MADPTPPSDVPDPASPTPASPAPGSKRIRSVPDRPAGTRPPGTVRSTLTRADSSSRTPSAYTDTAFKEKSWGRGLAILWALFLAMLLLEAYNATCYVLAGKDGWPPLADVACLALICTFFIALWSGLDWLRPVFVLVNLLVGAWMLTDCALAYRAYPKFMATGTADWNIYSSAESYPRFALGLRCLIAAAYVFFSDDVREFVAHRRARGRVWSALLTAVIAYGGMLLVFAAPLFYGKWMQAQYADAQRFGDETMRAAAQHWEANSFESEMDSAYAKTFTKADRATTFGNFKALGPVKSIDPAPTVARTPMPQYPLQDKVPIPQGITSQPNATGKGFTLTAKYTPTDVAFEHGHGKFGFDLARDLSGPWRITKLNFETVQYDRPPPKPAATPSPDASPASADAAASPAPPAASPGPTTSTLPTDAAAPSPTVKPPSPPTSNTTPATPTPPPAVATPTPAATPVPSTGG